MIKRRKGERKSKKKKRVSQEKKEKDRRVNEDNEDQLPEGAAGAPAPAERSSRWDAMHLLMILCIKTIILPNIV